MAPGTTLECVAGTVLAVHKYNTGTNSYGPWTIQNIQIGDAAGAQIKVKLMNQGELQANAVGHRLYIQAGLGRGNKLCGLVTEEDEYQGRKSLIVKTTDKATLSWQAPAGTPDVVPQAAPTVTPPAPPTPQHPGTPPPPQAPANPPPPAPAPRQANPAPAPQWGSTKPISDRRAAWAKVDKGLNKLRRLRLRTLAVALQIQKDAQQLGYQMATDHVEKIDSFLIIECCRNGLLVEVPDVDPPGVNEDHPDTTSEG